MRVHCLFEQSGTFKNEFKKLGHEAFDYDIQNEFGETDFVIDLFSQIEEGYKGEPSIFDDIKQDDLIMAFFPCIRFENQIMLHFRGQGSNYKNWPVQDKMRNCMRLQNELTDMYMLVNKLFILCIERGLQLIVENPYSEEHYLRRYWCFAPALIDRDRTERGDYFHKPTQYWFVNREPQNNFIFEPMNYNAVEMKDPIRRGGQILAEKGIYASQKTARSMIHPDYASRFIREFILEQ